MKEPKIKNKPSYCNAWVSKVSETVQCNTIPCCGFFTHGRTDIVIKGFDINKKGKHPLVDGEFIYNDGIRHEPKIK